MSTNIYSYVEKKNDREWFPVVEDIFDYQSYGLFGWLADVRNYSRVSPLSEPKGLPFDVSETVRSASGIDDDLNYYSHSWFTLEELLNVDYDCVVWDRRILKEVSPGHWNGAVLAMEGEGRYLTLREFLSHSYFDILDRLRGIGEPDCVRVVFWFA